MLLKLLLIVIAVWHGTLWNTLAEDNDGELKEYYPFDSVVLNYTAQGIPSRPPIVNLHGRNNYHAAQQIFYIYGMRPWKMRGNNRPDVEARNDYLVTPGIGAHKLHPRRLRWNRARRICIEEGGHLAVINSESEEKILLRMMTDEHLDEAYLGVHDLYEEGDFVTVLDEALETTGYTRWTTKFPNEPDNNGGNQNCAVLIKEGGMDDIVCDLEKSFFCEISLI